MGVSRKRGAGARRREAAGRRVKRELTENGWSPEGIARAYEPGASPGRAARIPAEADAMATVGALWLPAMNKLFDDIRAAMPTLLLLAEVWRRHREDVAVMHREYRRRSLRRRR